MEPIDAVEHTGEATGSLTVKVWRRDGVVLSQPLNVLVVSAAATFQVRDGVKIPSVYNVSQTIGSSGETTFTGMVGGDYWIVLSLPEEVAKYRVYAVRGLNDNYQITVPDGGTSAVEFVLEAPYQQIQFLAYYLHTGDRSGVDQVATISKDDPDAGEKRATADLMLRCEFMKSAIRDAYRVAEETGFAQQSQILKVFIAPEFYFQGAQSGYTYDNVDDLFASLRQEMDDERYRDWLFVPGTFVGYKHHGDDSVDIYNLALVYKGGPELPHKMDRWSGRKSAIIYKAYVSDIDFQWVPCIHGDGEEDIIIGNQQRTLQRKDGSKNISGMGDKDVALADYFGQPGKEWCVDGAQGGALFKLDGIVFGLEVCLDHSSGRLRNYYNNAAQIGEPRVQVQLIPSAGMSIVPVDAVARLICNVDKEHCKALKYQPDRAGGPWFDIEPDKIFPITNPDVSSSAMDAFAVLFHPEHVIDAPPGVDSALLIAGEPPRIKSGHGYILTFGPEGIPIQKFVERPV